MFFVKQKTAYEMRISDWSSDVCSSDLRHRTVKLFAGQFLRAFAFRGAGPVQGILDALAIIADLYHTGKRRLPDKVPLRFVSAGRRPFVIRDGVVDRAAYELCALSQLRDRLRAGDIWEIGRAHV